MSLLLDTHVILWWLTDELDPRSELRERLDHDPDVYVSAASVWEIAMKQASGKLAGPADLPERVVGGGFLPLAIDARHAIEAARLPMIHRDPFDRILVAGSLRGADVCHPRPVLPPVRGRFAALLTQARRRSLRSRSTSGRSRGASSAAGMPRAMAMRRSASSGLRASAGPCR